MQALDLFGDAVEIKEHSKPKNPAPAAPRAVVKLNRHKLWGEGGYLSTLDDDESPDLYPESHTENATIERLEQALFMSPVVRNGDWALDGQFYAYRITKPINGPREFGSRGSILRDATHYMVQTSAKRVLEEAYKYPESWLPRWAYWLFCHRLRKAGDNEDPYALLKAFTAVMTQHDFLDETRSGDTMRKAVKRHRINSHRAELRQAKAKSASLVGDDEQDDADELENVA